MGPEEELELFSEEEIDSWLTEEELVDMFSEEYSDE